MNPLIVIPAYNSNNSINILIKKIIDQTDVKILVIDDGSIDKINIKNKNAAILIRNNKNKGKVYVIKKAIKYALENYFTHLLIIDSDLQHDPKHVNEFLELDRDIDIVLGIGNFPIYGL